MSKPKKRKYIALKRYGKIVSLLVKEFKQKNKGKKSDIKKIRKRASEIYGNFTDTPLSKITKKAVISAKKVKRKTKKTLKKEITADMLKNSEFLFDVPFWEIGQSVINIGKNFPELLVNVKTNKRDKTFKGITRYIGELRDFIEELREDVAIVENETGVSASSILFFGSPAYIKGKKKIPANTFVSFAIEGEEPTGIPKTPTLDLRQKEIIEEAEEKVETDKKKRVKKKLKKKTKKEKEEEKKKKEAQAKKEKEKKEKAKKETQKKGRAEVIKLRELKLAESKERTKRFEAIEKQMARIENMMEKKIITRKAGTEMLQKLISKEYRKGGKIK